MAFFTCLLLLLTSFQCSVNGLNNGLALTPPMGFMTWLRYACQTDCEKYPYDCVNEDLIKRTVDGMKALDFDQVGYKYIIIDDCWPMHARDPKTLELIPDRERFPSGMKALSEYVSSKNFTLGIYLDFGTLTCAGYPGSMFYLENDLQTVQSWGARYVKMDGCYANTGEYEEGYETFSKMANESGIPMVFSCSYPAYYSWEDKYQVFDWARLKRNCNLWRMYTDIESGWESIKSIIGLYKKHGEFLRKWAAPGSWNDPDMLVIGNGGLSHTQERVQFGMWAIFAAPLLVSTNVTALTPEQVALLKNERLIAINQDSMGAQGRMVSDKGQISSWMRPLSSESYAIAIISENELGPDIYTEQSLADFGLPEKAGDEPYVCIDVFTNKVTGQFKFSEIFATHVPNTGISMSYCK